MLPSQGSGQFWFRLIVPVLVAGLAGVGFAVWSDGPILPAALTMVSMLLGCGLSLRFLARQSARALVQIESPAVNGFNGRPWSPFDQLVEAARRRVQQETQKLQDDALARTELEATAHLNRVQLQKLQHAWEALPVPAVLSSADDKVVAISRPMRTILESHAEGGRLPDEQVLDAFPSLKQLIAIAKDRRQTGDVRSLDFELTHGDCTDAFRATAQLLLVDEQRLVGVLTTLEEISRERAENSRHAEFVSSACHELKTPLASIRAYTEMLLDGECESPEEQLELMKFIDQQVARLTTLIDNMLNLARIESGVMKVHRENVDLNEVLQKALATVVPAAEAKQIGMQSELSDMYLPVYVDPELLGQAMINLLSNAVKYTPSGGTVCLVSRFGETEAVIEVQDTGIGIPAEALPRIFDRFYRVPENNKAAQGTGLGLALVHYVITNVHDGTIEVTSQVGQGTKFRLTVALGHEESRFRRRSAATAGQRAELNGDAAATPAPDATNQSAVQPLAIDGELH